MRRTLVAAALAALCLPAFSHDMWLVPPARGTAGEPVVLDVSVGMDFPASLVAIDPVRVTIAVRGPGGADAAVTLEQDDEAAVTSATFTPSTAGAWLVAAETAPKVLELEAAKFNDYLLHDGMPHVLAGRMDRGELEEDAVERYSKFVKAIVPVGSAGSSESALTVVGQTLEVVLLADPLGATHGDTLPVQVLFRGEPLERANLCWDHPGNGEDFSGQTWTDAEGKALVPVARSGPMTVRLVHMTRPQTDTHEWESFWASYTFHVR